MTIVVVLCYAMTCDHLSYRKHIALLMLISHSK